MVRGSYRRVIHNTGGDKFKMLSFGLSCLLAVSESLSLNTSVQANGIIHTLKILKDEIKTLE